MTDVQAFVFEFEQGHVLAAVEWKDPERHLHRLIRDGVLVDNPPEPLVLHMNTCRQPPRASGFAHEYLHLDRSDIRSAGSSLEAVCRKRRVKGPPKMAVARGVGL